MTENFNDEGTLCSPNSIKRVSKDTVNKILSAQVILNFGVAVKELVENAVDAKATVIEIKIKNYGLEGVEVIDNGCGITEANYSGITAKHHTSKLKEFSDLEAIKTFGFRGEALSSLCGLSNVIITTRHASSEYGAKLIYDHDGNIIEKSIIARNIGTTVSITDFFKTLPVRKAEFQKNYKKDFNKMVQLLQEYCLVLTGIKIICTNQPKSGTRQTILSTNGVSILENIISIFGAKQSQEIIKIKCPTNDGTEDGIYTQESLMDMESMIEIKEKEIDNLNQSRFKIEGYISNIDHNCGRSMKDRQFLYVNSRPCEMKNVSKLVNEVYHRYNLKQYPFLYLNLKVEQSNVDVNLSKDKRQVGICDDKVLLLVVKRSLLNTFGDLPTKFKYASINNSVKMFENSSIETVDEDEDDKIMIVEPSSNFAASLKQWKINPANPVPKNSHNIQKRKSDATQASQEKLQKIDTFLNKRPLSEDTSSDEDSKQPAKKPNNSQPERSQPTYSQNKLELYSYSKTNRSEINSDNEDIEFLSPKITSTQNDVDYRIDCKPIRPENTLKFERIDSSSSLSINKSNEILEELVKEDANLTKEPIDLLELEFLKSQTSDESASLNNSIQFNTSDIRNNSSFKNSECNITEIVQLDVSKSIEKFSRDLDITIEMIKREALEEEEATERIKEITNRSFKLKFKESIDPSKNKKAETELETEIKKDMFSKMKVLGQFNLGFIIAQLENDLFIVDQHATDERYNFEDLEKNLKIESQCMVVPEKLELTAIQEDVIIQNLQMFEMNGFKFEINHDGLPTQRIQLVSRPHSKNWEFGREDIEEMIYMLPDLSPNTVCRPLKIRSMLASRACRKSVMIGTALDFKRMMQLLIHMGEMDHPWNCPHGRPTIRFLQNLDFIEHSEKS